MRPKIETSDFKLLVLSKGISHFRKHGTDEEVSAIDSQVVQLRKTEQYFSQEGSPRLQQYTKILEEYDTWSQVFNQASKIPSSDSR